MLALNLSDQLQAKLEAEARQRGVPLEAMLETALQEWIGDATGMQVPDEPMTREQVIADLEAKGMRRGVAAEGATEWEPFDWPGVILSETVIEERGER